MYIETPYSEDRELPSVTFRQIDLPEILKWEVGGQYYIVAKVEMTGLRNMKNLDQKSDQHKIEGDFQLLSVMAVEDKPVDTKKIEKKAFEKLVGKIKSGEL
jgi:hypothetical protein